VAHGWIKCRSHRFAHGSALAALRDICENHRQTDPNERGALEVAKTDRV
jgi:hypothetical protein